MEQMNQDAPTKTWYVIAAVVVIALVLWYVYMPKSASPTAADTSTTQISAELNQIPDDSSLLNQDASASAADVSSF